MMIAVLLSILWFLVWILLSWPPDIEWVIMGALASIFVTFMTIDLFKVHSSNGKKQTILYRILRFPARVFWFVVYIFVFIWECLMANLDVAFRVIHPSLPIRPGTIKIKTELVSDTAVTLLANSMTLTPGTTSIDIDREGGYLYVHWLCVKETSGKPCQLPTARRYEWLLKKVFE